MPQKKKSSVRESKPLAETPKSSFGSEYAKSLKKQNKRQSDYDAAKRKSYLKPHHYREDLRQGKSKVSEKHNRLGSSFTSEM